MKILLLLSMSEIKIDLTLKKSNILYFNSVIFSFFIVLFFIFLVSFFIYLFFFVCVCGGGGSGSQHIVYAATFSGKPVDKSNNTEL